MINTRDILETINMIDNENLDVRTVTMGISLLDCIDSDIHRSCDKVYDKICRYAERLVQTGEDISHEYGIPIVNKRIAVTPIAMLAGANPTSTMCTMPAHWIGRQRLSASTSSAATPHWCTRASAPGTIPSLSPSPKRWPRPIWSAPL